MILCASIFIAASCEKQVFDGSRTSNDGHFILSYSILNCTKTYDMKLEKGTLINVAIENKSGHLYIFIEDSSGNRIYNGDDVSSGKFPIEVQKTDTYKFLVTGKKAKGSVSFITNK